MRLTQFVFYRIAMYVIEMLLEIKFAAYPVLPIMPLPNTAFAIFNSY
jgi:hypothetical protein